MAFASSGDLTDGSWDPRGRVLRTAISLTSYMIFRKSGNSKNDHWKYKLRRGEAEREKKANQMGRPGHAISLFNQRYKTLLFHAVHLLDCEVIISLFMKIQFQESLFFYSNCLNKERNILSD